MFGMGMTELIVIAVVALLALGPERLPDAARKIGKTIRDLRRQTTQLKKTIEEDSQLGDAMKEIRQALRDDPFREPPEPRPKPKPEDEAGAAAEGGESESPEEAGEEDQAENGVASGEVNSESDGAAAEPSEPIPVEPRMLNMSEFQKYVHMWGPQAAAEKYGTSQEEAEAAIDAVIDQAASAKQDADR